MTDYLRLINYLTFKKILNYLRYKNDIKHRKIVTSSFPIFIAFQSSAYCNSNCKLCPVGLGIKSGEKGYLEFNNYKQIIDEAKKYLINIFFGDWGEPFLNPDIFDMIKYAERNKIVTSASTNLHHFKNEKDLINLLNCGLSYLTISLHGVSQKTYEAYQPNKNFKEIVKKIKIIIDLKKKLKSKKPIIDLMFAISKKNQHEIERMWQFAKELGVNYSMYTASLNLRFYSNDYKKLVELIEEWAQDGNFNLINNTKSGKGTINKFYKTILKERKINFNKLDKVGLTARHFCIDPWTSLVVNWNGTISLCCVDYSKYVMGDTNKESIINIWNNKNYKNIRNYLLNEQIEEYVDIPCRNCIRY
jgi:radical SAM protein with 4Fe4S-binding SPASM domain